MKDLNLYIRYYSLEDYIFGEVHDNFVKNGYLKSEEFFAIIIWKSNRAKTKVKTNNIKELTSAIALCSDREDKLKKLIAVEGIGIPIASAILAVCYPASFTVVDYRARLSLEKLTNEKIDKDPTQNTQGYFEYVDRCIELAKQYKISLRDFDRALWGMDFYDGEKGLKDLVSGFD